MKNNTIVFTQGFAGESLLRELDLLRTYPLIITRSQGSVRKRNTGDIFRFSNKFQIYETNAQRFIDCATDLPSGRFAAFDWTKDFFHNTDTEAYHIHPSLLPMYRGYGAVSEQFLRGVCVSGASIYRDNGKIDAGGIVYSEKIRIEQHDTPSIFLEKCASIAAVFITRMVSGEIFTETEQDESKAFYPARTRTFKTIIDFNASAFAVHNFIRAYSYPYGMAFFTYNGCRFRVAESCVEAWSGIQGESGEVISVCRTHIEVACGEGSVIISKIIGEESNNDLLNDIEKGDLLNISSKSFF